MSISTRVSIAWAPSFDAHEPTSTAVLTGRRHFIDQRVFLPVTGRPVSPGSSPGLQNGLGVEDGEGDAKAGGTVEWAFGGTREAGTPNEQGWTLCRWTHLIDSRTPSPASTSTERHVAADEGWCRSPYLGDETLTEEEGEMVNPETGKMSEYREVWRDPPVPPGSMVRFWEQRGVHQETTGMIGRVGKDALGVGRDRPDDGLWTWRLRHDDHGWHTVFEEPVGASRHGRALLERADEPGEGEQVEVGSETWTVLEAWTTE